MGRYARIMATARFPAGISGPKHICAWIMGIQLTVLPDKCVDIGYNRNRHRENTHTNTAKITGVCQSQIAVRRNRNERCSIARMKT